ASRSLGTGGLTWTPVLLGAAGTAYFTNQFREGPLAGNESTYTTYSLGLGAGPRIGLLRDLSVLPGFSVLYAYTENDFDAGTDLGRRIEQDVDGRLVNWRTQTLTLIPSLELRYRPTLGPVTVELSSSYSYFATIPIARSTEAYSFTGDSQIWSNRVELEVLTPWAVAGWPLLAGAFGSRGELFGGLSESLKADHFYATGAHVALDPQGRLWTVTRLGLAGSYFWAHSFSGWTLGVHWAVAF
ncbi:MAG: Solitary outer membrane autotransporter beta-barrel domain, partial [Candidatus Rokuibacteriota bacterium]